MNTHIYIYIYIHTHARTHARTHTHTHTHTFIHIHIHTYTHTFIHIHAGREVLGSDFSALLIHIHNFAHEWAEWGSTPAVSNELDIPFRTKNEQPLTYKQRLFLTCCMQPSKVCMYVCMYVCRYVCMCACIYVAVDIQTEAFFLGVVCNHLRYVCVCVYVCMYVCMYVCSS
jgi:hypothetical protein